MLQGELQAAFRNSSSLVTLDLGYNRINGIILNWIGRLSNLTYLILNNNNLKGNVSIHLCQLDRLRLVDFSHNDLVGHIPHCLMTALRDRDYLKRDVVATIVYEITSNPSDHKTKAEHGGGLSHLKTIHATAEVDSSKVILPEIDSSEDLDLPHGGHLSHGFMTPKRRVFGTSIYFESMPYRLDESTGFVVDPISLWIVKQDWLIMKCLRKLIIAGASAYQYLRMRKNRYALEDCRCCWCFSMMDMAHISGLVAAFVVGDPFNSAISFFVLEDSWDIIKDDMCRVVLITIQLEALQFEACAVPGI
ncbi:hypothetical protein JRO89_XS01G0039600 [Xanthoceras sorbifolium]|uniref:Serine hydroxymethyltransferase-like domain-containing protein n=1 Tax=Xanthoceras sorbifolium TaxID=99658 RepID=A0ABQ8IJK3_9ROSI|nr:hypothetical protein JRO89_XS01G0039600 [Xanthoceras sorbifolium]